MQLMLNDLTFTAAWMLYRKVQLQETRFLFKQAFIIVGRAV